MAARGAGGREHAGGRGPAGDGAEVAAVLAEARLDAIDRLAGLASEVGARHVLVAGDVFDADTLAPKTIRQALARIGRAAEG